MDRVAGIPTGGSERAFDLNMKCRYLQPAAPRPRAYFRQWHANHQFLLPKCTPYNATSIPEGPAYPGYRPLRRMGRNVRRSR